MARSSKTPSVSTKQAQFMELFSQHEPGLRRYILSLQVPYSAVDDIVQDAALALWKKFESYDVSRPFAPWANRFTYLQVLKYRTKHARNRIVPTGNEHLAAVAHDSEHPSEIEAARLRALDQSLDWLPESDRQLLHCRYGSQETIQTLAKRRGTSVHKLYHALDRIRIHLMISVNQIMIDEGWDRVELA